MKTLLIPDIHTHVDIAIKMIQSEPHDRAIFLGDWFDEFGDDQDIAAKTATRLEAAIEGRKDDIFLLGNHDVMYLFSESSAVTACSGFTEAKARAIRAAIDIKKVRERFRLYTEIDGYFISHAGLHPFHDKYMLRHNPETILAMLAEGKVAQCLRAGVSRGGNIRVGGIDWLDWNEFEPIPGMNQICGHTPAAEVRYREGKDSKNWCIDTQLRHYAVIDNGVVKIKSRHGDEMRWS